MNAVPPNRAIVKINNDSFWSERDLIRISDDRYAVIYRVNVRTVTGEPDEEFNHFKLAATISVIKASCGWDESSFMVVMINNAVVRVWPRFDGQLWIAEDREENNFEGLSERTFLH